MKIRNNTKKTLLAEHAELCTSLFQKARGLMFRKQKDLIFVEKKERHVSLHMCFVFYPIDVIYLNKDKKVVEIKESFLPFAFYWPKQKAQYIIELRKGTIAATKTALGHQIAFQSLL